MSIRIIFPGGQQQHRHCSRPGDEPEMMLFDEPTSALDPEMIGGCWM